MNLYSNKCPCRRNLSLFPNAGYRALLVPEGAEAFPQLRKRQSLSADLERRIGFWLRWTRNSIIWCRQSQHPGRRNHGATYMLCSLFPAEPTASPCCEPWTQRSVWPAERDGCSSLILTIVCGRNRLPMPHGWPNFAEALRSALRNWRAPTSPTCIDGRGDGSEAAARQARYAFLLQTAEKVGARFVATAHTARRPGGNRAAPHHPWHWD